MSYCRPNDGDVYMFPASSHIECRWCSLCDGENVCFLSRLATIEHLRAHQHAGHVVPSHAIVRLIEEIERFGDEYRASDFD